MDANHNYRNARQSLLLIEHAYQLGLKKLFATGMQKLDKVEATITAYQPSQEDADEHASCLILLERLKRHRQAMR